MHDAVALEEEGIPTAVIVTEGFLQEAYAQRSALGMEGLDPVIIEHPVSTLTDGEIMERARQAAPQVRKVLLGH